MPINVQGQRINKKGSIIVDSHKKEISKGNISNVGYVRKFGENPVSANGVWETVWDGSNIYVYPPASSGVTITSDSDYDDPDDGDGAQSVHIYGLESGTWALQDEVIAMSGSSIYNYVSLYRAYIIGVGVSGVNVGTISININAVAYAKILPDEGQTLMAVYTIPSGVTGYVDSWRTGVIADESAQVKTADFRLRTRKPNESMRTRDTAGIKDANETHPLEYDMKLTEMTDIWVEAKAGTNSTKVTGGFNIELETNDVVTL